MRLGKKFLTMCAPALSLLGLVSGQSDAGQEIQLDKNEAKSVNRLSTKLRQQQVAYLIMRDVKLPLSEAKTVFFEQDGIVEWDPDTVEINQAVEDFYDANFEDVKYE